MILFFLVCRVFNWPYMWKLHFINILLLVPAIIYTLRYTSARPIAYPYLRGLGAGLSTSVKSGLIFAFFFVIYLSFIEPEYMESVRRSAPLGSYMNPLVASLVFFTEQVCSGFIITLIAMQGFKHE